MNLDSTFELLPIHNAEVYLLKNLFDSFQCQRLYDDLMEYAAWQQDLIKIYGRKIPIPRLTAWYGNEGISYTYSGILMQPHAWTETLLSVKKPIETRLPCKFNSVLLNQYRNGKDSVDWHSDDEPELGKNPTIASFSVGASRKFQMRSRLNSDKIEMLLNSGDLLIMSGETQQNWQHRIPKMLKVTEPRINLTFRTIYVNTQPNSEA